MGSDGVLRMPSVNASMSISLPAINLKSFVPVQMRLFDAKGVAIPTITFQVGWGWRAGRRFRPQLIP